MTVGRTEKPLITRGKVPEKPVPPGQPGSHPSSSASSPSSSTSPPSSSGLTRGSSADDPKPLRRAKPGVGSYEDAGERQKKAKGKAGRPGR